jgi:hypothetical protein
MKARNSGRTVSLRRRQAHAVAVCAFVSATLNQAAGQPPPEDATLACQRAATRSERDWHLPAGLLAAIGTVESGRPAPAGMFPIIWPWTINAEGRGFYQPSKAAAVGMVRALQLRGVRVIDVGCFQVDLFYHPYAFASLADAFDPDANARAAARILSLGRLSSTGWDGAISAYHSAWPLLGAIYLQKVLAVWPSIRMHPSGGLPAPPEIFAALLSPQARLVKVVAPTDPLSAQFTGLPRVIPIELPDRPGPKGGVIQWLRPPVTNLPRVLPVPASAVSQSLAPQNAVPGGTP